MQPKPVVVVPGHSTRFRSRHAQPVGRAGPWAGSKKDAVEEAKGSRGYPGISRQLQSMAEAPDQQGVAGALIRVAADRTSLVASWIDNKEPDLLTDVQCFAHNHQELSCCSPQAPAFWPDGSPVAAGTTGLG